MDIIKIRIENIKGIKSLEINDLIKANRPNILVAPNGFGKTSIATAFQNIEKGNINLKKDDCYNKNESIAPSIEITLSNNDILSANKSKNTINKAFKILVANSQLKPEAFNIKIPGTKSKPQARLTISQTECFSTIPQTCSFKYSLKKIQFGNNNNNKILPNINKMFNDYCFLISINKEIDFTKLTNKVKLNNEINDVVNSINSLEGNKKNIRNHILNNINSVINIKNKEFNKLQTHIKAKFNLDNDLDAFLYAWQYWRVRNDNINEYSKIIKYLKYKEVRNKIDEALNDINPVKDRYKIKTIESKGKLLINWPPANQISSGQRDIMLLMSKFMLCSYCFEGDAIIVIDEFFDYLDDANLVIFQYFVSKLIEEYKKSERTIFPIILTHLDPIYLNHFCFNKTKMNICYLKENNAIISNEIVKLIQNRENDLIKDCIDKYYFHYHYDLISVDFTEEFQKEKLNKDWGKPIIFKKRIINDLLKYLYTEEKYDPFSICIGIRILIEEYIYNKLNTQAIKEKFINTHGTKEKLEYADSQNGEIVPEIFFLLGIIYNHPLHDTSIQVSKSLAMKLENLSIKGIIKNIWSKNDLISLIKLLK